MAQHSGSVAAAIESKVGETIECTPSALTQLKGSENIHPGCILPVLYRKERGNCLALLPMIWGLVPSYLNRASGEPCDFFRMFNARSETCTELPAFSRLVAQNESDKGRCVVFIDGFYEWKTDAVGCKQPYYVHLEGRPMLVAGLWDTAQVFLFKDIISTRFTHHT